MYSIGEIISLYRKKKGLLQQDLADELAKEGITISYKAISNWERNLAEPSVTIFYKVCRILGITNMYEAYFGVNPADPFSSLTDEGREKAMDYINLLHASGMYEKKMAKIIPFRSIDIFENAVSAGTGNFLVDGPKKPPWVRRCAWSSTASGRCWVSKSTKNCCQAVEFVVEYFGELVLRR